MPVKVSPRIKAVAVARGWSTVMKNYQHERTAAQTKGEAAAASAAAAVNRVQSESSFRERDRRCHGEGLTKKTISA